LKTATPQPRPTLAQAQSDTQAWLERAVIGLNLCPFAKAVHAKGQIRYVVNDDIDSAKLLDALIFELKYLAAANPASVDTTLLIATHCLEDFLDYNDFLDHADLALDELGLEGTLQVASFHPDYQFAGTAPDDITNYTNRSPYPTLHLIREASITRAVEAFPNPETIFDTNMQNLKTLGLEGWAALDVGPHP